MNSIELIKMKLTFKQFVEGKVWDKKMPQNKRKGKLTPEQKARAKERARRAGRPYPNMVDNMAVSREK